VRRVVLVAQVLDDRDAFGEHALGRSERGNLALGIDGAVFGALRVDALQLEGTPSSSSSACTTSEQEPGE
jgi:hypothetical protein